MSIRPIDMQLMVQRSGEVNKLANNPNKPLENAQQFATQLQKEAKIQDEQVTTLNKTEKRDVDKDGKGNNKYSSNKKNSKEKNEEKEEHPKEKSNSMFDIKV